MSNPSRLMAEFTRYGFSGVIAKLYKNSQLSKVLYEVIGKGKKEDPKHDRIKN
jgi:hypothetical protein